MPKIRVRQKAEEEQINDTPEEDAAGLKRKRDNYRRQDEANKSKQNPLKTKK